MRMNANFMYDQFTVGCMAKWIRFVYWLHLGLYWQTTNFVFSQKAPQFHQSSFALWATLTWLLLCNICQPRFIGCVLCDPAITAIFHNNNKSIYLYDLNDCISSSKVWPVSHTRRQSSSSCYTFQTRLSWLLMTYVPKTLMPQWHRRPQTVK